MGKIFQTLYAKASNGKTKVWEILALDNIMIIRNGYLGGKMAEQKKEIFGKNIGRSNETTDKEQCVAECQSKWQKKIDEQYTTDMNDVKDYSEQEILLPMLALDYHKRGHDITFPCYVQPKLNGVRCIFQDEEFVSRKGKTYDALDHLYDDIQKLGIKVPDGEIYIHGATFQSIVRKVKKYRPDETEKLEYWIYDQINTDTFDKRYQDINTAFNKKHRLGNLVAVPVKLANNFETIKKWHDKWVQEGYEGAIIRNMKGLYKVKHRSKDLQKYKEFFDEEFIITGAHAGTGSMKGCCVFEVKTKDGKTFSVMPRGTVEARRQYYMNINDLIGKELTVRYQEKSEDGIPIFPVGIAVRDYE